MSSAAFRLGIARGAYPERMDPKLSWLDQMGDRAAGAVLRRARGRSRRGRAVVRMTAGHEAAMEALGEDGIGTAAADLRGELHQTGFREEPVSRSFALVRELARRHVGERHYDVQILGGWLLLNGMVAEMETGEGKTLTATLPACTAALAGIPVHVITVNDYLAARDAEWMGPIYRALGLSVGLIQHGMDPDARRAAYASDVTYCTNKEIAFDYLKDRITLGPARGRIHLQLERLARGHSRSSRLLLRGLCFGIVDEADSVLVDEARTPLIISADRDDADDAEEELYETALDLSEQLTPGRDFEVDARERSVRITPSGEDRLEELARSLPGLWAGRERREDLVTQALTARRLFIRDRHYLVADGKVHIVDEYTGRLMPDRSWERGLHQMIEAKEECELTGRKETLARISYQRFFRRYLRLAGMTGTAREVAGELWSVYRLPVARVPTNRPLQRQPQGDRAYPTAEAKWRAVATRIRELHEEGRPVLVGTRSVEASEHLSRLLAEADLDHQVLNARQDREEAEVIARAGEAGRITVATNMAGRGTDIRLSQEAKKAGGLHVIATERHEAGRIDRQLFGRCGRQGDPGSFEAIVSLEDELVRAHGSKSLRPFGRAGMGRTISGWPGIHRTVVRHAQRRAERLHSRIRRELLKTDDQIASVLAFSGKAE